MEILLHVNEDETPDISALELIQFLTKLRSAYVAARMFVGERPELSDLRSEGQLEGLVGHFQDYVRYRSYGGAWSEPFSRKQLPADVDLRFRSISRNSPMEFLVIATGVSIVALALAVCASGGKVDLRRMRFEVNPPKETIRALRDLFRR